ncbi:MAG: serine hydrolase [Kiritimatiellae bacterium]|nr:serine hydrolase [Kiritimatiellia bacterium]
MKVNWHRGFVAASAAGMLLAAGATVQNLPMASPESQGVPSEAILGWIRACEEDALTNRLVSGHLHGFVLVRHGRTIAEGTWAPQNTLESPHMLYSHSKSFVSTAIGFLVDDGKIDLDRRVISFFPDQAPAKPSENLRQARVRDLLTMNLGADHTDAERDDITGDWVKAILRNRIDREPGTGFRYDSAATHLLAAIVEKVSGRPLMDFLKERLFDPLGMKSPWSTVSPTGVACGGWGMNMTTRDLARFGQFFLQEGRWGDRQLLSREWVRLATARQTWSGGIVVQAQTIGSGSDWKQGYGFQFWRCRHGAYRADGASGQYTVVFPEQDVVLSIHAGIGNMQREIDLVWEHLLPAFGSVPLAARPEAERALREKCAKLALPTVDKTKCVFEGLDGASVESAPDGWTLVKEGRRLSVGKSGWAVTRWKFSDTNVEPLFVDCGTREIAAIGRITPEGKLSVTWQFLGGIRHGRFEVSSSSK